MLGQNYMFESTNGLGHKKMQSVGTFRSRFVEVGEHFVDRRSENEFFFSSRRRHTRSFGDWSSDVCSSDLGVCGEVCPPRCIRFHANDGGKEANTPYINPVEKGCTLCGLCMEFCPTEALTVTPIREIRMGIAQIDRTACYRWGNRGVCGACLNICPLGTDAIRTEPGTFRPVVQSGCVGCGLCVEVCPQPSLPIKIVDYSLSTKKYFEKISAEHEVQREPEQVNPGAGMLKY